MKRISESKIQSNTIVALSLIPLSGLAMDVFIPSLPDMAVQLHTTPAAIQLTLSLFIISYGVGQLIVGGIIDSYGRYWPSLVSMLVFSAASFIIAFSTNLQTIYAMRIVQGFTTAMIVVSKRAYFVDVYTGDTLKKYTNLFSLIWSIAPIVAPFIGGFFQTTWGWASNFIFLGFFGLTFFFIDLLNGGESIRTAQPFSTRLILNSYGKMLKTTDFSMGIIVLGFIWGMLLVFGMAAPFLIEHELQYSPVVTGYISLFSGVSVLIGNTVSRILYRRSYVKKIRIASSMQLVSLALLIPVTFFYQNLVTLMMFVFMLHSLGGFIFNNVITYCMIRFPQYAGKASGLIGGGFAALTSVFSSLLVNTIDISNQTMLGAAYAVLAVATFLFLVKTGWKGGEQKTEQEKEPVMEMAVEV